LEGNSLLARSFHVRKNNERVLNASSVRNEQNVPNVRSNYAPVTAPCTLSAVSKQNKLEHTIEMNDVVLHGLTISAGDSVE